MRFYDEANIKVSAGNGGNGCVSFFRGKHIPKGGPDGGDGGRGASIILEASKDMQTLIDFRYQPHYRAKHGDKGHGAQCYGRGAEDLILKVPVGTIIRSDDGMVEADLVVDGQRILVAQGGKGGLGNMHFRSSTNQTPRQFTPGEPGEEREIFLELKLISHVGFVGFPNAGKSTLLRSLSSATPKVGDYPFTTLAPHLGVLAGDPPVTLADIPGIIEDAHRGAGLGIQFLKHISRSACLLFVLSFERDRDLDRTYGLLLQELKEYDPKLLSRPRLICVNKSDLVDNETIEDEVRETWRAEWNAFKARNPQATLISAKHHQGLERLIGLIRDASREEPLKTAPAMVS